MADRDYKLPIPVADQESEPFYRGAQAHKHLARAGGGFRKVAEDKNLRPAMLVEVDRLQAFASGCLRQGRTGASACAIEIENGVYSSSRLPLFAELNKLLVFFIQLGIILF